MEIKTRGLLMTAFEAVMALEQTRSAVNSDNLQEAKSRFSDYLATLNRMMKDCTDGKRDLDYVVSESPFAWSYEPWLTAMKEDVTTIKGEMESGASLIATLLEDCGCKCALKES
ncbi:hypothetical protein LCGC14_1172440 [marine sediment metagenome]|uniref:Uncharacterized protein n=1 Tax=marine sediment metagenome TaxID=412755 RepID=A0A0F9P7J5_9ZZZZ